MAAPSSPDGARGPAVELHDLGPRDAGESIEITLVLRHHPDRTRRPSSWPAAPRADAARSACAASDEDVRVVHDFAQQHGLEIVRSEPHRRAIRLRGTVATLQDVLGVQLGYFGTSSRPGGVRFGSCHGLPRLPDDVAPRVLAVLGLDERPVAQPRMRRPLATPAASFTPPQLGALYAFPGTSDGGGQTIAIIELGGGYVQADLDAYFGALGLATPSVAAVSVDGGGNAPGSDADGEVMLDIEVAGALASGARIVVYFAPNTDQGFYNAVSQAAHDTTHAPSVISISWGGPEDTWSTQAMAAMNSALEDAATLGVTVTVACGDNGSSDGENDGRPHVDFPSSSPYALACGGTRLQASGTHIESEVVWNEMAGNEGATGGGVSAVYALPGFQQKAGVPAAPDGSGKRGVPDVSAVADPLTGYRVRVDGKDEVIGGTSAVAPLWAALVARLNGTLGRTLGYPHGALYALDERVFRDIVAGDNGDFAAGPGWDACTGLGSPDGDALLKALQAAAGTP